MYDMQIIFYISFSVWKIFQDHKIYIIIIIFATVVYCRYNYGPFSMLNKYFIILAYAV